VVLNVLGLYCVGLPLGLALAFRAHLNLTGLWYGVGAGAAMQVCHDSVG
jgi:hypothetical protein